MMTEQEEKRSLIHIRPARETDLNLVYATWLRGLYYGNPWFREIDKDIYFQHYEHVLKTILLNTKVSTLIACLKEDEDVALGYSVIQNDILHWVFVKPQWRKIGLAKDLTPTDIKEVSHLTVVGSQIKPKGWKFNPFLNL